MVTSGPKLLVGSGDAMGRSVNKVMLIGTVGRGPEMRFAPHGRPVTTFSLGTSSFGEDAGGRRSPEDEWFNVVAWGSLAERCADRMSSGQLAYVEGSLRTRDWTDSQGNRCARVDVVASEVIALDTYGRGPAPDAARDVGPKASRGEVARTAQDIANTHVE